MSDGTTTCADSPPPRTRREIWVCLALVLAVLTVYAQVRGHDFVSFDDDVYVTSNARVLAGLTWDNARWAFGLRTGYQWTPLAWLSLMLDHTLAGPRPAAFHLTNVVLHLGTTLLLFALFRVASGSVWRSALVAAWFGIHPLNAESVAWITERKSALSAFWGVLALLLYVLWVRRRSPLRYAGVLATLVLAILAKPVAVVLPLAMLLLDFWPLGRWPRPGPTPEAPGPGPRIQAISLGHRLWEKAPLFLVAAAGFVAARKALLDTDLIKLPEQVPIFLRVQNALVSVFVYLYRVFWPFDLACIYPYPEAIPAGQWIPAALGLLALLAVVLALARTQRYLAMGCFWFLGLLLPMSGLMQAGVWPATADRFMYLPQIGVFIILAWGIPSLVGDRPGVLRFMAGAAVAWTALLMPLAWLQVSTWRDSAALFRHAVVVSPCPMSWNGLAGALVRQGQSTEARHLYAKTLQANPGDWTALLNLGTVLRMEGLLDEAALQYRKAIDINPGSPTAHNNLGVVLWQKGDMAGAAARFRRALDFDPAFEEARFNLRNVTRDPPSPVPGQRGPATPR